MTALISGLSRNWTIINPPVAPKQADALKFGILGAASIAPLAFIGPAKSHPEVVVHAVAARDRARAAAFAKSHGIPVVKDSYDDIINDPEIDAVYIPLPNGLHFEWALKALAKGKHVLLEKPATSNAQDAKTLFTSPLLSKPNAPVLMEAFHSRFSPAWQLFMSTLDPPNISHVHVTFNLPPVVAKDDDIRFNYNLGGGAAMDMGPYVVMCIRSAFGAEPINIIDSELTPMAPPREQCDHTFKAHFAFPNGGIGGFEGTNRGSRFRLSIPSVTVKHKPVAAPEEEKEAGSKVTRTRKVIFWNYLAPPHYHRIDIIDEFAVTKSSSSVVKRYTRKEFKKAYTYREMGRDEPGETYWSTYRHMLEQFVNNAKGRKGNGLLMSHEESINQAKVLDSIYEKAGWNLRPTSEWQP